MTSVALLVQNTAFASQLGRNNTWHQQSCRSLHRGRNGTAWSKNAPHKEANLRRFPDSSIRSRSRSLCTTCEIRSFHRSRIELAPLSHRAGRARHDTEEGTGVDMSVAVSSTFDHKNVEAEMKVLDGG